MVSPANVEGLLCSCRQIWMDAGWTNYPL